MNAVDMTRYKQLGDRIKELDRLTTRMEALGEQLEEMLTAPEVKRGRPRKTAEIVG